MSFQVKILIVEDETLVAMNIADMLESYDYQVLQAAISYAEALKSLEENLPDFALIDIDLGGKNTGIDLAKIINEKYKIPFIYLTSHSDKDTINLAKATKPNGYILKPFEAEDLYASIEVALANYSEEPKVIEKPISSVVTSGHKNIFVKTDKNFLKVNTADIMWLQSDGNYLFLHIASRKIIIRSTFKDFMRNLPQSEFIQIHKSYWINIGKIESFTNDEVCVDGTQIPLSRSYKDEFLNKLNRVI